MFSQTHNRDLLKKHDPNKDYNIFWELLLSSPTPQFTGFYPGDGGEIYKLAFGNCDENIQGIKEIQRGIIDFVCLFHTCFGAVDGDFSYMYRISGRDAYAPMLLAASHNEKYSKAIKKKFDLKIHVE